jgi:hypothetical protein
MMVGTRARVGNPRYKIAKEARSGEKYQTALRGCYSCDLIVQDFW